MSYRGVLKWLTLGLASVVLVVGLAACGDDDGDADPTAAPTTDATSEATDTGAEAEIPEVTIPASDFTFDGAPSSIAGGLTRLTINNTSTAGEDHQAQLFKLNEGVMYEDFVAASSGEDPSAVFATGSFAGGPLAAAGNESSVVMELEEGEYVMLCQIPSPSDGVAHAEKGMIQPLTVTAPPDQQPDPPEADYSVSLQDFSFDMPDTAAAGETTIQVDNDGAQAHEMAVAKLNEGATFEDFEAFLNTPPEEAATAGPPPFALTGGIDGIAPAATGWAELDLESGATYVLACFFPNTSSPEGTPHFAEGMVDSFTVE